METERQSLKSAFQKGMYSFSMASQELLDKIQIAENLIATQGNSEQIADALYQYGKYIIEVEKDREIGLKTLSRAKECYEQIVFSLTGGTMWDLEKYCFANKVSYKILEDYYRILLVEAQNMVLESYFMYLEKNREPKDRFYMPKCKQFRKIGFIQALQDLLDDKYDIVTLSGPPGCSKTTFLKFFHSGVMGWFPEEYNLFFSHSAGITRMYYDSVLSILTDDIEYTWKEIFPNLQITSTNAKLEQINIGAYKPFPNLQTASVGSEMAGKVRASKFLMVDDMIGKIDEALNKSILDKLWNIYSTDARQRKVSGCKEIHIATRWSVHDIIGRLKNMYQDNPRCKFISVPDIDPLTGKSNFDFEFNGFTEEFYKDQELLMDDITYRCLYKNEPIEREGLLYHEEDIRRYLELPLREPDAIIGICDTKAKGTDFFVLPVMYQYGDDYYMVDCICNDSSDFGVQYQKMANIILNHNMQQCEFESNTGGDRVAYEVERLVKEKGGRCNITTKPTETNKETKIIVNSDWVKKHIVFKDSSMYGSKDEYGIFMNWMMSSSVAGKNTHDDVVDALAMFALYATRGARVSKVEPVMNPFRSSAYYGGM